ncbi:hypothetical protein [Brevundimonas sp.]|uniref:hypothetical protein n=1 Tax=Brevundimonas sp. TaxID=1871086 RepID=UPI0025F46606|nr:hypothetical protein [Brevundimonas sp.]
MRTLAAFAALAAVLVGTSAASASYPTYNSYARMQQCSTQSCVDCVNRCDRDRDQRIQDCNNQFPRPGENQEMCYYWAHSDHNLCLMYECGV